jgi:hypothetical protein
MNMKKNKKNRKIEKQQKNRKTKNEYIKKTKKIQKLKKKKRNGGEKVEGCSIWRDLCLLMVIFYCDFLLWY